MRFNKYSGLGNDFIIIDQKPLSKEAIIHLCDRHDGIGADGVIFCDNFQVEFFNPDGSNPSMCGNGLRSLFLHLHREKKIDTEGVIRIGTKSYRGTIQPNGIAVELGVPKLIFKKKPLTIGQKTYLVDLIDTGVPHFVVEDPSFPFDKEARALRYHESAPQGANVNFIVDNRVRTYERGVEDETYACGTGIAASAYSKFLNHAIPFPIILTTVKNKQLTVDLKKDILWIEGPATFIFQGEINLDIISQFNR